MAKVALERYRIIDMGNVLAGPLVTQLMADMGAEVIKVETRNRLDGTRRGRPIVGDDIVGGDRGQWPEMQPLFHCLNRNKLGITVNIKEPKGLALVTELTSVSDVVVNNSSSGAMDRLGLGYPVLRSVRPDIIVASMPGAGEEGPLREVLAYASITSALSGLMGLIGYPPVGPGQDEGGTLAGQIQGAWCDVIAALTTLTSILAALRHRDVTGEGQYIEVAQLEASVALLGEAFMEYGISGRSAGLRGTRNPLMAPHNNYPCLGDDKWVSIAIRTEVEWQAFCGAIGNPPWTSDPRFADAYSRSSNIEELDRHVAQWTRERTPDEAAEALQSAGVAAVPVMNIEDQFVNNHFRDRGVFVELEHPKVGTEWVPGIPWQLSNTPGQVRRHAPLLGEHNRYVIHELLGYSAEEYRTLDESGVLA